MGQNVTTSSIDMMVVVIYLTAIFSIGFVIRGRVKTDADFAIAGRTLPTGWIALTSFASWVGLAGTFGTPENVYKFGLSGSWWFQFWMLGILLMAYLLAARLRSRLYMTIPELITSKTSPVLGMVASLVASWNYLAWAAVQVFALNLIFSTFNALNSTTGAVISFLIVVSHTLLGGLRAVVLTDMVQSLMILSLVMILGPVLALSRGEYWHEIFSSTQNIPDFYSLFKGAGNRTLLIWFLSLIPAAFIDPGGLQRVFAAKEPRAASRGLYFSAILYFLFGISITFLGIAARAMLPDIEAQKAMPMIVFHLFPMGLTGLLLATFLAIAMSTADTALLVVASTLQRDVYAHFRRDISERERLVVNRVLVLLLGIIALVVAIKGKSVVDILLLGFSIYVPGLLLPVLSASFEWRLPKWSILWTMIAGAVVSAIWVYLKEPAAPAIVMGLTTSAVPFLLGFIFRRN